MAAKKPDLRTRAMQCLARREHSRTELRAKLLPHLPHDEESGEAPDETALDAVLDDLERRGWLSDERAAAQLVQARRGRYGTLRIVHELRQKGMGESLIASTIPDLKETEFEAARDVWRKKFGNFPTDQKEKARQVRFLQSRGFPLDVVFKVLRLEGADDSM